MTRGAPVLLATALLAAGGARAATMAPSAGPSGVSPPVVAGAPDDAAPGALQGPIVDRPPLFSPDDLLLFEVHAAGETLSDGLGAYSSRAGVFVPLGELSRLLDLAIVVDPSRRRAEGWVASEDNRFRLDLDSRQVRAADKDFSLSATDAAFQGDEIYVRLDLLQRILPLDAKADLGDLTLTLTPRISLPFQDRLTRARRRIGPAGGPGQEAVTTLVTPYEAFTAPSIDINLSAGAGNHQPHRTGVYEVRAAGDLAWTGLQVFAGSDSDWRLNTLRVLATRKDPDGRIAGPFGATLASAGDTFSPTLALGARSVGGRGVAITSAPLEQLNVFDRVDLRGELPLGFEVELYVNEVLRAAQSQPIQGRYEFLQVSLAYGQNVVRLVFYGPHGERREEVRRVNVGGGQLAKGQTVYSFGAVQEGAPLFDVDGEVAPAKVAGQGQWRIAGNLSHGISASTTVSAGVSQYTPRPDDTRRVATLGVATSVGGYALQLDTAGDDAGGAAAAVGLAGRVGSASLVARHSEYAGGFIDEVQPAALGAVTALRRNTTFYADLVARLGKADLPLSLRLGRDQFVNGERRIQVNARLSQVLGRYLISSAWDYQRVSGGAAARNEMFTGALDASVLTGGAWQMRGGLAYELAPTARLKAAVVSADRQTAERSALHLSLGHGFEDGQTTVQAAQTWRLRPMDLSLAASYTSGIDDFRVGLQINLGLTFDPLRGRYRALGPGAASGGAVAVQSFVDSNGDGRRQAGERALPGVSVLGGRRPAFTDAAGEAVAGGLGDGAWAQVQIDADSIDDPYLAMPPRTFRLTPRPGRVAVARFPLTVTGEVELHVLFRRAGQTPRGLSAVKVQLVDAAGQVVAEGRSEYDGTLILEGLRPGAYAVRLDPEQARRLKLTMTAPVDLTVPATGGFAGRAAINLELGAP
jgi:hypothetical protein